MAADSQAVAMALHRRRGPVHPAGAAARTLLAAGPRARLRDVGDGHVRGGSRGNAGASFVIGRRIVLDTVTAVGIGRADRLWYGGFRQRMRWNIGGRFITAEHIERWNYYRQVAADALRSVPSLEMVYTPRGPRTRMRHPGLHPHQLLDQHVPERHAGGPGGRPAHRCRRRRGDRGLHPFGDAPAEYNSSMGAACGVVVVWTRAR